MSHEGFVQRGCTGTRAPPGHCPLPVLAPVILPEASRRVAVTNPDEPFAV